MPAVTGHRAHRYHQDLPARIPELLSALMGALHSAGLMEDQRWMLCWALPRKTSLWGWRGQRE